MHAGGWGMERLGVCISMKNRSRRFSPTGINTGLSPYSLRFHDPATKRKSKRRMR